MPYVMQATPRTGMLAWMIGVAALLLPLALLSYAYPQWILLTTQGPCIAVGIEAWYVQSRWAGGLVTLVIVGLAIFGVVRGGPARVAGALTIGLVIAIFFILAFASYVLFHVAPSICV